MIREGRFAHQRAQRRAAEFFGREILEITPARPGKQVDVDAPLEDGLRRLVECVEVALQVIELVFGPSTGLAGDQAVAIRRSAIYWWPALTIATTSPGNCRGPALMETPRLPKLSRMPGAIFTERRNRRPAITDLDARNTIRSSIVGMCRRFSRPSRIACNTYSSCKRCMGPCRCRSLGERRGSSRRQQKGTGGGFEVRQPFRWTQLSALCGCLLSRYLTRSSNRVSCAAGGQTKSARFRSEWQSLCQSNAAGKWRWSVASVL